MMKRIALFLTALVTLLGGVIDANAAWSGATFHLVASTSGTANIPTAANGHYKFTETSTNIYEITIDVSSMAANANVYFRIHRFNGGGPVLDDVQPNDYDDVDIITNNNYQTINFANNGQTSCYGNTKSFYIPYDAAYQAYTIEVDHSGSEPKITVTGLATASGVPFTTTTALTPDATPTVPSRDVVAVYSDAYGATKTSVQGDAAGICGKGWQGVTWNTVTQEQLASGDNVFYLTNANGIGFKNETAVSVPISVSLSVYPSETITNAKLRIEGIFGTPEVPLGTLTGGQWNDVTVDLSQYGTCSENWNYLKIYDENNNLKTIDYLYVDNFYFTKVDIEPAIAPTNPQEDVLVVFSRTYGKDSGVETGDFYGVSEGNPQSHLYSSAKLITDTGGNNIYKVIGAGFSGRLTDPNNNYDATAASVHNVAHVAIWPTTATKGRIFQDGEYNSVYTEFDGLTPGQWNYVSVPINFNKNYILVYLTDDNGNVETTFFLDHFYVAHEVPTVPTPVHDAAEVRSIYGSFYTSATTPTLANWGPSSTVETEKTDGNSKILKRLTNVDYAGYEYSGENGVDITGMHFLHADVYPVLNTTQISFDVITGNSGTYTEAYYNATGLIPHQWNSIDIPISELTLRKDDGHIYTKQLKLSSNGADNFNPTADFYITNIYYYKGDDGVLTSVDLTAASNDISIGGTTSLTALPKDNYNEDFTGATLTYSSSNSNVARVTNNGNVMGVAPGTATITVTATSGGTSVTASTTINVLLPVPTAPTDAAENVLVVFSDTYGKSNLPKDNNSGYGNAGVPNIGENGLFTTTEVINVMGNHPILHVVGLATNGRPLDPNNGHAVKVMTGYTVAHAAVWPTTATKARIFSDNTYSTNYTDVDGLIPGQWNYITVPVDFTNQYLLIYLSDDQGTSEKEFYLDHFYVAKDENAPVLVEATLSDYDATSATLSLKATDVEVANINYIITLTEVGTENTTTIRTTGANGAAISYDIDGLKPATAYSATIVANDGANNSESSATVTFTTTAIPPATTPTAQNVMSIYSNAYATNYLQGIEVNNGGTVQNYNVAEGDEVKQVTGATTITIRHNGHDADPETYNTAYIAIYPTGSTTEVTLTPTFYNSQTNTVSQTYSVIPGQWNYLSFRPADFRPEGYSGKDLFELVVSQQAANTLFFDNFYYTSVNDVTAPVYASHTQMAAASSVVFNLNYTDDTDEGTLTFKSWNEYGGYEGDVTGKERTDVRFRINNLDPETTYNYTLKVSDEAGNTSADRQLTVTTPIVTGDLRVNDNPADPDAAKLTAAGMVYITGVWDTDKFIAIDQEYCATAYDLTEVDFRATGGARLDRDYAYFTFNPNAILVSPKLNKFNINYVMYDRDGETLYGYNFDMIDGDFPAETFYSGNPLYSEVIAPGIANGKYTRGMDASKYLKLDPFTGFKKIVTGQNFAFSRNLNNGDNKGNDVFATVILPFAVDVNNSGVQGSDAPLTLYELSSAVADENNNITLKFEEVTGVGVTNKPYLVKSNIDNGGGTIYFIDSNVPKTLTFPEGNLEAMKRVGASTEDNNATLFGTYVTHEATSNGTPWEGYNGWFHTGIYGLAGGNTSLTLQEMAATTTSGSIIPAWRSMVQLSNVAPGAKISLVFIDHEDEPSDPENPETPEVNPGEGETTAITRPATDSEINAVIGNVYSIDGRKVSSRGNSFMQLPAGIYIVNGKKVIVK